MVHDIASARNWINRDGEHNRGRDNVRAGEVGRACADGYNPRTNARKLYNLSTRKGWSAIDEAITKY